MTRTSVTRSGQFAAVTGRAIDRNDRRMRLARVIRDSPFFADDTAKAQAQFLTDAVLRRADSEFIHRHPAEGFAAHMRDLLGDLAVRQPGEIKVRCYRPMAPTHGYDLPIVLIETQMDDQPFIIDTVKLALKREGVHVLGTLNMILPIERDSSGQLLDLSQDNPRSKPESVSCQMLSLATAAHRMEALTLRIQEALDRAKRIASDFRQFRKLVRDIGASLDYAAEALPAQATDLREAAQFAGWLADDNFVFMGAYGFDAEGRPTGRLGLGRYDAADKAGAQTNPVLAFGADAPLVSIFQSRMDAPVHRDAPMVEVRLRLFDADGEPAGGAVLQGLFTFKAVTNRTSQVPFLRRKLAQMVAAEDLVPSSHRMKLFLGFFDRLPLPFLFAASESSITTLVNEALDVEYGSTPRVWYRIGQGGQTAQVFAMLAQSRYDDEVRLALRDTIAAAFGATDVRFRLLMGKTDTAILDFLVFANQPLQTPDPDLLSDTLTALVSPLVQTLRDALRAQEVDEAGVDRLTVLYGAALPPAYALHIEPRHLVEDTRSLDAVAASGQMVARLRQDDRDAAAGHIRLLVYSPVDIALTDILPVLDNFGLRVLGETTWPIVDGEGRTVFFETYRIESSSGGGQQLMGHAAAFLEALYAVLDGRMNNTPLNALLLPARLTWRQLQVIRAYAAYARQLGVSFPANLVQQVLLSQAELARTLMALFDSRFNPQLAGTVLAAGDTVRTALVQQVQESLTEQLRGVQDATEDKVVRMFANFISATLRTNYFQRPDDARGLSFKFQCDQVELMPEPRPLYEIWVYDPRIEGIHLRGGKVARGGLRWSDRLDDFRTEILGLMQTQMVKNTLIVPVGSKGGFVLKRPEKDDAARRRQADDLYKVFIHGLLDLTDNLLAGQHVPPLEVVVYDEPDPYLVVAADKGTAHLSDTANTIALSRGFWLGDAFASGGSQGYDHKKYGITAKGAWVCVQRHFRELGVDIQTQPFTVFGIGDMSGDVFGNGMLLSPAIQLLAAFDHRHIFLDPSPDPAVSLAERQRLFDTPRSSWLQYDPAKISRGGGVFSRTAKAITLTPEVQAMLGVQADELSGAELMRAILCMQADLFWNGGIGTFVKASHETHADAGDKTNDAIRLDATELRCKVVGEGGNLGFTQAARVEAALRGVRLNTDAVDNSAGVDLSDHEVNLKIAFAPLLQEGRIDMATRDALLFAIDQQVCQLVTHNNGQQSLGLSMAQLRSAEQLRVWGDVIRFLATELKIDQHVQMLPGKTLIAERKKQGLGLTRPELARISAFAKMWMYDQLRADKQATALVEADYLAWYFPAEVREQWPEAVAGHMLRNEIVATLWTNSIVDFSSALLIPRLFMTYGRTVPTLCQTYAVARRALGLYPLREALLTAAGQMPAATLYQALVALEDAAADAAEWLLASFPDQSLDKALADVAQLPVWSAELQQSWQSEAALSPAQRELALRWRDAGVPDTLVAQLASVPQRSHLLAIWQIGRDTGANAKTAAHLYFAVAEHTGLLALLVQISKAAPQTRWEAQALASLGQGLAYTLGRLVVRTVETLGPRATKATAEDARVVVYDTLGLGSLWELASQIAAEGVQIPALVVLSEKVRARLR
jgi:glutamate dehydrogenase